MKIVLTKIQNLLIKILFIPKVLKEKIFGVPFLWSTNKNKWIYFGMTRTSKMGDNSKTNPAFLRKQLDDIKKKYIFKN
tara:strand:+ start:459 stop:692 length:234 start_codon:yes stop_codon:yes gene_type:complete